MKCVRREGRKLKEPSCSLFSSLRWNSGLLNGQGVPIFLKCPSIFCSESQAICLCIFLTLHVCHFPPLQRVSGAALAEAQEGLQLDGWCPEENRRWCTKADKAYWVNFIGAVNFLGSFLWTNRKDSGLELDTPLLPHFSWILGSYGLLQTSQWGLKLQAVFLFSYTSDKHQLILKILPRYSIKSVSHLVYCFICSGFASPMELRAKLDLMVPSRPPQGRWHFKVIFKCLEGHSTTN